MDKNKISKKAVARDPQSQALLSQVQQVICQSEKPLTHNDIITLTGIKYRTLRGILAQLKNQQLIYFHPPKSYFHRMVEATLGKMFTIRPRQSVALPEEGIIVTWVKISQKWVQNEEMGYSYDAELEIKYRQSKKTFCLDWYDRTAGEMEIDNRVLPGFHIHVHDTDARVIWLEIRKNTTS